MTPAAQIVIAVGVLILLIGVAIAVVRYARSIKLTVGKVAAEFAPNSGKTLRDAINRLESKLDPLTARVDDHEARITKLEKPRPPRKKVSA